ncbi:MAG: histidine phosphatase family protein [Mariprofundaceae bacterium]|nr:histidine phosphatase family protein [Mariprofundaceae bacterium]
MKTLLLIRHAKAGWGDFGQSDISRTLTERGKEQAHRIAKKISLEALTPDAIFSSPAQRTQQTCEIIASNMGYSMADVIWRDALYLAEADLLFATAQQADDCMKCIAIIAHNPGLSELANRLLNNPVDGMSPATAIVITWPVQHWQDISMGTGTLQAYLQP